jgi:hypothetical protein
VLLLYLGICLGQNEEARQVPPFTAGMSTFMALMRDFQSIEAVPDLNRSVNQDRFVFHPADEFHPASERTPQFPLTSQFKPQTPRSFEAGSAFATPNPSQFASPSTAPRFPSRESSTNSFPNQMTGSVFSPTNRESLIGHLVGLARGSLVLTPRQRLALDEENRINQKALSSFRNPAQQTQAGFLNKQQTVGQAFNLGRGRQGNRFQNIASGQNNEIFNSKLPFKIPA